MQAFLAIISVLCFVLYVAPPARGQTNLLVNPGADHPSEAWSGHGEAMIENVDGNFTFTIRNQGSFRQDVKIAKELIGKYVLMIGRGSSERINPDGAITGLPYLYGYMMGSVGPHGGTIVEYLQGMRADPRFKDEWVTMFGILKIPERTVSIRFFLEQAKGKDVPQNGSAARFDDVGLYVFDSRLKALRFVESYKNSF